MTLQLRADTYFCIANHRVALLDLKADRYFCLPLTADIAFQKLASGQHMDGADLEALEPFVRNGLLQDGPDGVTEPRRPPLVAPISSAVDAVSSHGGILPMVEAVAIRLRASKSLKRRSLHAVITDIRQRKATSASETRLSYDMIGPSLAAFLQTRRLMPTHDRCLPWSIAMADYLSRRRCFPDLVIGVKMKPFAAHAWVQLEGRVLSDRLDEVLPYTPILVV